MSPNARKATKRKVNLWMEPEERKMLEEAAEAAGMNKSDFIKHVLFAGRKKKEKGR